MANVIKIQKLILPLCLIFIFSVFPANGEEFMERGDGGETRGGVGMLIYDMAEEQTEEMMAFEIVPEDDDAKDAVPEADSGDDSTDEQEVTDKPKTGKTDS